MKIKITKCRNCGAPALVKNDCKAPGLADYEAFCLACERAFRPDGGWDPAEIAIEVRIKRRNKNAN